MKYFLSACVIFASLYFLPVVSSQTKTENEAAIEEKTVTITAKGRGFPHINFDDGAELNVGANRSSTSAKLLTAADFDSDGTADLMVADAGGNLKFYRGNVDSIYPNSPEAVNRKALGNFIADAFYPSERNFALPLAPDYLEAGDFNADGLQDILAARKGDGAVYLLAGDGAGNFADAVKISVDGQITALKVGEIGQSDGLTDAAVAIFGKNGARLLVFEHPGGAFNHPPEIIKLKMTAENLTIGNLDTDYFADIAVAKGNILTIVRGRGQVYPWDSVEDYDIKRPEPIIEMRAMSFQIAALVSGYFTEKRGESLAMLTTSGSIEILDSPTINKKNIVNPENLKNTETGIPLNAVEKRLSSYKSFAETFVPSEKPQKIKGIEKTKEQQLIAEQQASLLSGSTNLEPEANQRAIENFLKAVSPKESAPLARWNLQTLFSADARLASAANSVLESKLVKVRVSDSGRDELAFIDAGTNQIHLMIRENPKRKRTATANEIVSLDTESSPAAILPMRLNVDALSDLVVLRANSAVPSVVMTAPSATFTVTTAADEDDGSCDASCSLREAIDASNNTSGTNVINFNIGGGGSAVIRPDSSLGSLPRIIYPVTINGTSQPGFAGQPLIEIKGDLVGLGANGFSVNAANVVIRGFVINQFDSIVSTEANNGIDPGLGQIGGTGIAVFNFEGETQTQFCIIEGNYLGTDLTGTQDRGNDQAGLLIYDSDNNTVGGSTTAARNVLSGNGEGENISSQIVGLGLSVVDGRTNLIFGNYIGTSANGLAGVGNSTGLGIAGMNNQIGSDQPNTGNLISGNKHRRFSNFDPQGCFGNGIGEYSLISLSTGQWTTANNLYKANRVGLTAPGIAPLSNCRVGLSTSPRNSATIGSITENGRNTISGNTDGGLYCTTAPRGGGDLLVQKDFGPTIPEGFCRIIGNNVGTDVTGNFSIPNDHRRGDQIVRYNGALVVINTETLSTVGGNLGTSANSCTGNCNLVSGNGFPGVYDNVPGIVTYGLGTVSIYRNFVGTNKSGTTAVSNYTGIQVGVFGGIPGGGNTNIGGLQTGTSTSSLGNLVSGNRREAINIFDQSPDVLAIAQVRGNLVGTNAVGLSAIPNCSSGEGCYAVLLSGTEVVIVGGANPLEGNVISGNNGTGILFFGDVLTTATRNNYIGVNRSGQPLGNSRDGIELRGTYDYIGDAGAGNIIANNGRNGIFAADQAGTFGNRIKYNSIYNNGALGIDLSADRTPPLDPDGVTPNDCLDVDELANKLQNYPILSSPVFNQDGTVSVEGGLQSKTDQTYTVDFYANDSGDPTDYGEGQTYIGSMSVTTDDFLGLATFQFVSTVAVSPTAKITATATDFDGNTSEFSCYAGQCESAATFVERVRAEGELSCVAPIIVNVNNDREDTSPGNNICDVDLETGGLQCSLRAAIQTANAHPGADIINFNIPGTGDDDQIIVVERELDPIGEKVKIDGSTQPGFKGFGPAIQVEGATIPLEGLAVPTGFFFGMGSDGSELNALTVLRFTNAGVVLASNNNEVKNSFIGTEGVFPEISYWRQSIGILVSGSGNTIGGNNEDTNLLSGNNTYQVVISGASATGNKIRGNIIGYNAVDIQMPTDAVGIGILEGASENEIGGAISEHGNIITSTEVGIYVNNNSNRNKFQNNQIAESPFGMFVINSSENQIGGEINSVEDFQGNYFDGNENGIIIDGELSLNTFRAKNPKINWSFLSNPKSNLGSSISARNKIQGNLIGLTKAVTTPPTDRTGIGIGTAEDTLIGGENINLRNQITDQTEVGIVIRKEAVRTVIQNNFIGINGSSSPRPNLYGIRLGGAGTLVKNNRISGNTEAGININRLETADPLPTANIIQSNRIGTNAAGSSGVGNSTGILIDGNLNSVTDNLVSGNTDFGIVIFGEQNSVSQNKIGTNLAGDASIAQPFGVLVEGSTNTINANTVSGNGTGILIVKQVPENPVPTGNIITGNFIGTNPTGTFAIPNTLDGIGVGDAANTLIGGFGVNMPAARNVISGNGRHGIRLVGSTGVRISGNYIGTKSDGVSSLGNTQNGIFITQGTSGTIVGGQEPNAGNTIAFNGKNGFGASADAGNNNIIDPNIIFGNTAMGIDLGEDGHTPNDPFDADTGPNKLQNYPEIVSREIVNGELIIGFKVDSAPENSAYGMSGIYIEFFKSDLSGEGEKFIGFAYYTLADYNGGLAGTKNVNLGNITTLGIAPGDPITATATDADGNTSEFTPPFVPTAAAATVSGKVTANGESLVRARVILTDSNGRTRTAFTNSFGTYSFENVAVGETFVFNVTAKQYTFNPRILTVSESLTDFDFEAQ
ncbi:MAG TPA: CSLREA domain-containing protein [Pyrinomonadaceae bacterium]|nr:CSLREA domain-containing protein [Pyrinomonadaceae bacterium]